MSKPPILRDVTIRNFKAIRDSQRLKLTPLTVLIGKSASTNHHTPQTPA